MIFLCVWVVCVCVFVCDVGIWCVFFVCVRYVYFVCNLWVVCVLCMHGVCVACVSVV